MPLRRKAHCALPTRCWSWRPRLKKSKDRVLLDFIFALLQSKKVPKELNRFSASVGIPVFAPKTVHGAKQVHRRKPLSRGALRKINIAIKTAPTIPTEIISPCALT